jgi:hemolysin III
VPSVERQQRADLLTRWPNPWPTTFGYHEVWHLLTVVAAVLHFAAVTSILA